MNAGKILSLGLLSALMFGCEQSTQPVFTAKPQVEGRQVAPMINALTKVAALQAGYSMSYQADTNSFDPFDASMIKNLQAVGICQNVIDMINEVSQAGGADAEANLKESPRFKAVVTCLTNKLQDLTEQSKGVQTDADAQKLIEELVAGFDQCICNGSGSFFGAIGAYAWKNYSAPQLNAYTAPQIGSYRAPTIQGYQGPSLPGYKAPSL